MLYVDLYFINFFFSAIYFLFFFWFFFFWILVSIYTQVQTEWKHVKQRDRHCRIPDRAQQVPVCWSSKEGPKCRLSAQHQDPQELLASCLVAVQCSAALLPFNILTPPLLSLSASHNSLFVFVIKNCVC